MDAELAALKAERQLGRAKPAPPVLAQGTVRRPARDARRSERLASDGYHWHSNSRSPLLLVLVLLQFFKKKPTAPALRGTAAARPRQSEADRGPHRRRDFRFRRGRRDDRPRFHRRPRHLATRPARAPGPRSAAPTASGASPCVWPTKSRSRWPCKPIRASSPSRIWASPKTTWPQMDERQNTGRLLRVRRQDLAVPPEPRRPGQTRRPAAARRLLLLGVPRRGRHAACWPSANPKASRSR